MRLLPEDRDAALEVRIMDRFFDNYVMTPMQKPVFEACAAEGDATGGRGRGARSARHRLSPGWTARWRIATWAAGEAFSMADCAAAPSLFYADWVAPDRPGVPQPARLPAATAGAAVLRPRRGRGPALSALLPARRARPRLIVGSEPEIAVRLGILIVDC